MGKIKNRRRRRSMLLVLARICSLTFVVPSVRLPVTVPLRPGLTDLVVLFGKGDNSKVSSPREDGGSSMPNPMRSVQNGKDDFQASWGEGVVGACGEGTAPLPMSAAYRPRADEG